MNTILQDIIEHQIWANDTLLAYCENLSPETLALSVPDNPALPWEADINALPEPPGHATRRCGCSNRESNRSAWWREQIAIGDGQVRNGQVHDVNEALWLQLNHDVDEMVERGDGPSLDVCPQPPTCCQRQSVG